MGRYDGESGAESGAGPGPDVDASDAPQPLQADGHSARREDFYGQGSIVGLGVANTELGVLVVLRTLVGRC